jgi:hypothetical protein
MTDETDEKDWPRGRFSSRGPSPIWTRNHFSGPEQPEGDGEMSDPAPLPGELSKEEQWHILDQGMLAVYRTM